MLLTKKIFQTFQEVLIMKITTILDENRNQDNLDILEINSLTV